MTVGELIRKIFRLLFMMKTKELIGMRIMFSIMNRKKKALMTKNV